MASQPRTAPEDAGTAGRPSKRLRVSQACEPCRLKKGKCDGRQPTCNVCGRHGLKCSYNQKPRRRGLRPGQYSGLERRAMLAEMMAAFLASRLPGAEESVRSFFCFQDPDLPFLAPGERQAELDRLLAQWKAGPAAQWLLETSARTDPVLDQMSRLRSHQGLDAGSSIVVGGDDQQVLGRYGGHSPRPSSVDADVDLEQRAANADAEDPLPSLPDDIEALFDVYFAYTHTWLPFVDKFKLTAFSANLSLAWAVVAYASLRTDAPGRAGSGPRPRPLPAEAAKQSLSSIPALDADMRHEHVQALVVLAMFFFEVGSHRSSWLFIGIAGRTAVDMSTVAPSHHLSSTARRTSLACFVVEGLIAAALGRKPQLPSLRGGDLAGGGHAAADSVRELEAEGWEEWSSWEMPGCDPSLLGSTGASGKEPFRVLSTFNHAVLLVEILNVTAAPSFNPSRTGVSPATLSDASSGGPLELSTWAHRVSSSNPSLAPGNIEDAVFPHTINIHALCMLIRCKHHLQNSAVQQSKQRHQHVSRSLASAVNDLAIKYQTIYPSDPPPLGLTSSVMTAECLLDDADDPLRHSLSKILSTMRDDRETSNWQGALRPFLQQAGKKSPPPFSGSDIFAGRNQGMPKTHVVPEEGTQMPSRGDARREGESGCYMPPRQGPPAAVDLGEGLDMDVMGMDMGETSSISAHDLTVLDAAVWNDELLTRNLGFIEDSQTALDPELSHLFDPSAGA